MASMSYLTVTLLTLAAQVIDATILTPLVPRGAFGTSEFPVLMDVAKMLLQEVNVQTSLCRSLNECGWNRTTYNKSVIAFSGSLGGKKLIFLDASCKKGQQCGTSATKNDTVEILFGSSTHQLSQAASPKDSPASSATALPVPEKAATVEAATVASANEHRLTQEMNAVRLSLLVGQSCTESGPRQCWRSPSESSSVADAAAPRKLRPVTITFGEPRAPAHNVPESTEAPLISSLKHFRLTSM